MLEKTYQPAEIEPRIREIWDQQEVFKAGRADRKEAPAFCIVIPPPNVTGSLHMGHALNNTLQDILCRFERMRGKDVLWQPGMDHAGIATQMVVERQLAADGEPDRRALGRDKFLEKVWTWKEESGGTIINQLRRLGVSCDWSRERFTMDKGLSQAVVKVFVALYKEGLIYKDKRLVNWDPKFQTAISDLEVVPVETKGHLWHFKYPLKDDPSKHIIVATTRPETMLGDTAVAVHPDDDRYKALIGKHVVLPLVGREIPIVGDAYSDPEKGTGAVKITPAHDFNDFDVGKRHGLDQINVLDAHGKLLDANNDPNNTVPEPYRGMDRFVAREKIVADMEALGLLDKIEEHAHTVPHGDRSNVVIEPWLTDQWYVDAETLAKPAIEAIETEKTRFVPKNWEKTYFEWMRNIQPWCISRQLWWGHQIPAWYGPDGEVFVAHSAKDAAALAKSHYKKTVELTRDEDVLDTWFSSALWPFSTLGWPEKTPEIARFYPTSTLVTGFDIIFFWIARMMMMGLHFMKEVPFRDIYIHALVRDAKGQKMSKSKGNVIDPLELVDEFGADALRFTLSAMAAQGRDIKLSTDRVKGYRNFATKLWNASRLAEMNECVRQKDFDPASVQEPLNRWIVGKTEQAVKTVGAGIETYRFNEAASSAYEFTWGIFCDWYLELIKSILAGDDDVSKSETRATVAWVLDQVLKILHPFMPYITEELWTHMVEHGEQRASVLALSAWPEFDGLVSEDVEQDIGWVVEMISEIRSVRAEMNVPAGAKLPLEVVKPADVIKQRIKSYADTIQRMARLDDISYVKVPSKGAALIVIDDATLALPLAGVIDMEAERSRLNKEMGKAEKDRKKAEAWLANSDNVAKSPAHVVALNKARIVEHSERISRLQSALKRIEG
ncbi:MAG: valine--tRNA ligase [Alphaproteobacteria bacterium]|nr:valine--tRNA ligase [Alphaproteobacteria bacterium]